MATIGGADVRLRYVAVGLRARNGEELRQLIRALDQCIITNNTP
jgi:hypothetical protein